MAITARVRGTGRRYKDGQEALEIHIARDEAHGLPTKQGARVKVHLKIGPRLYTAGLRSTRRNRYVWICPNLDDGVKLADALARAGFKKNQAIELDVSGETVALRM